MLFTPKHQSYSFDSVFSFEHLYSSYLECLRGIRWKSKTQRFISNDLLFLKRIYESLHNNAYIHDKTNNFKINERGKTRHISANSLKDRIVHKCLCDYFLTPILSSKLIYDCAATIKHKGTSFAKRRIAIHLNQYIKQYGNDGFCLTFDISHYFDSINHDILINMINRYVYDKRLMNLISYIINSNPKGLGLGSQVSQICAVFYLNGLDHYIKEQLHIKLYGRYMDDFYIIHKDKTYLKEIRSKIKKHLYELELKENYPKCKIHKLSNGFIYLKTKYIVCEDNKILKLVTTNTFKSMKRKVLKGIDIQRVLPSWLGYIKQFNCYHKFILFKNKYLIKNNKL